MILDNKVILWKIDKSDQFQLLDMNFFGNLIFAK